MKKIPLNKFKNLYKSYFPIKAISFVILLLCAWSYYYIAIKKEDLVLSVLALSIISIILVFTILNFLVYLKLKNKLNLSLILSDTVSKTTNKLNLAVRNCNIPSFFNLKVSPLFSNTTQASDLILSGKFEDTRFSNFNVSFPHRGYWEFRGYELEIGDVLGISKKSWQILDDKQVKVRPKPVQIQQIPMIASSARSGDELNLPKERSGEPFDIKPYEKSDGVRRILWKTYARTKELYVRRPELAVIPEGEVAIFLIAKKEDDAVAAAALKQVEYLNQQDLVVCFGVDGSDKVSYQYKDIEEEILKSAFSADAGKAKSILKFIKALEEQNYSVSQINVFCPEDDEIIDFLSGIEDVRINLLVIKSDNNQAGKSYSKLRNTSHNLELNVVNAY